MTNVTILCLHKITDEQFPSWPGMSLKTFERLLKYISKKYEICLPNAIPEKPKKKLLILTFDDGYEDFYTNAFPLLKKYQVPAVLNVVVNCVVSDYQIWTQQLNDVLDTYAKTNSNLEFQIGEEVFNYSITTENAENLALEIFVKLLPLQKEIRESIISTLERNAPTKINTTKMMNVDQLKEVSDNGIQIGSHSLSHPNLKVEDDNPDLLKYELTESKIQLERILNKPVEVFAYPNGMYSDLGIKLAKEAGYKYILLVDNNIAEFKHTGQLEILDRILIYSNNHFKNLFRINNFHTKLRKWLK